MAIIYTFFTSDFSINKYIVKKDRVVQMPHFTSPVKILEFVVWNAFLSVFLGKYFFYNLYLAVNEYTENYILIVRILAVLLAITIFCVIYYHIELMKDYLKSHYELIEQPCPVEIISPYKKKHKITLKNYLKNQLFFEEKKIEEIEEIFQNIYINKTKYNENTCVMFVGLPGVGKTQCSRVFIKLLGGGYVIYISRLLSLGKLGISILEDIFKKAEKEKKPLLFDDGEVSLLGRHFIFNKKKNNELISHMEILIYKMLELISNRKTLVIFTSNMINICDKAFARRFDFILEFPMPNENQLVGIWNIYLTNNIINRQSMLNTLAENSLGLSGRDIKNINSIINKHSGNQISYQFILDIINNFQQKKQQRLHFLCENYYDQWVENYKSQKNN